VFVCMNFLHQLLNIENKKETSFCQKNKRKQVVKGVKKRITKKPHHLTQKTTKK